MNGKTLIRKPRGAFFGRRKGHPLRAGHASLIKSLLPDLAIDVGRPPPRDAGTLFKAPVDAVRLEIGLGGGELRFATDWPDYAEWTLLRFIRSPLFRWTAERADDWRKPWPEFPGTRYEEKAEKQGRPSCYLTFLRL